MRELLLLGAAGSGKSIFAQRLRRLLLERAGRHWADEQKEALKGQDRHALANSEATMPTVGVELSEVELPAGAGPGGGTWSLREVGGSLAGRWASYLPHCDHVLFLADAADPAGLASAQVLLHEVLLELEELADLAAAGSVEGREGRAQGRAAPHLLLLLNKADICTLVTLAQSAHFLGVPELLLRGEASDSSGYKVRVEAASGSALDGSLCAEAADWIARREPRGA
jgi:GTPase SAR1 family protein